MACNIKWKGKKKREQMRIDAHKLAEGFLLQTAVEKMSQGMLEFL